jgi:hypothetical protein
MRSLARMFMQARAFTTWLASHLTAKLASEQQVLASFEGQKPNCIVYVNRPLCSAMLVELDDAWKLMQKVRHVLN